MREGRAVEANALFVQACPDNADRTVRARWQLIVFFAPFAGFEHGLVPAKFRSGDHGLQFPHTTMDEFFLAWCDGEGGDNGVSLPDGGEFLSGVDDDQTIAQLFFFGEGLVFSHAFDLKGRDVRDLDCRAGGDGRPLNARIDVLKKTFISVVAFSHKFESAAVAQVTDFRLLCGFIRNLSNVFEVRMPNRVSRIRLLDDFLGLTNGTAPIVMGESMTEVVVGESGTGELSEFPVDLARAEQVLVQINLHERDRVPFRRIRLGHGTVAFEESLSVS